MTVDGTVTLVAVEPVRSRFASVQPPLKPQHMARTVNGPSRMQVKPSPALIDRMCSVDGLTACGASVMVGVFDPVPS